MKVSVETDTATGFRRIYKNQAVIVLTDKAGITWNGIIRSPSPKLSLIRYNENGVIRERRIPNQRLVPAKAKPNPEISEDPTED